MSDLQKMVHSSDAIIIINQVKMLTTDLLLHPSQEMSPSDSINKTVKLIHSQHFLCIPKDAIASVAFLAAAEPGCFHCVDCSSPLVGIGEAKFYP